MFDFLKINKLTATHSEKISDRTIVLDIVNAQEAKNNLSNQDYQRFMNVVREIMQRKKKRSANLLQYEHRAFAIAYEIEKEAQIPYEKICGAAKDILYVYSNRKPQFEDAKTEMINSFKTILDDMLDGHEDKRVIVYTLASSYLSNLLLTICRQNSNIRENEFLIFLYKTMKEDFIVLARDVFVNAGQTHHVDELTSAINRINEMCEQAARNTASTEKFIETYTRSFAYFTGVQDNTLNTERLISLAKSWNEV